jgi:hypothetical protein
MLYMLVESLLSDSSQIPSLLGRLAPFGSRWYKNHGTNSHTERGWLSVGSACWALSLGLHLVSNFKKYVFIDSIQAHHLSDRPSLFTTHRVPRLEIAQSACLVFLSSSLDFGLLLGIGAKCLGLFPFRPIVKTPLIFPKAHRHCRPISSASNSSVRVENRSRVLDI